MLMPFARAAGGKRLSRKSARVASASPFRSRSSRTRASEGRRPRGSAGRPPPEAGGALPEPRLGLDEVALGPGRIGSDLTVEQERPPVPELFGDGAARRCGGQRLGASAQQGQDPGPFTQDGGLDRAIAGERLDVLVRMLETRESGVGPNSSEPITLPREMPIQRRSRRPRATSSASEDRSSVRAMLPSDHSAFASHASAWGVNCGAPCAGRCGAPRPGTPSTTSASQPSGFARC